MMTTMLVLMVSSCSKEEVKQQNVENNTYTSSINYEELDNAIMLIINNNIATEDNINTIKDKASDKVISDIVNHNINNGSDFVINNKYEFNGCLMVQASNNNCDYMYKLKIESGKITDYVKYELYYWGEVWKVLKIK